MSSDSGIGISENDYFAVCEQLVQSNKDRDAQKARAEKSEAECLIHRAISKVEQPLVKELIADRDRLREALREINQAQGNPTESIAFKALAVSEAKEPS